MGRLQPTTRARMRVLILRAAYTEARAKVEAAAGELQQVELPNPSGQQKYDEALIAERSALEAYMDAARDLMATQQAENGASKRNATRANKKTVPGT